MDNGARILELIKARRASYVAKRERHDPLADDSVTHWEMVNHTVEAFDWMVTEAERALGLPLSESVADAA